MVITAARNCGWREEAILLAHECRAQQFNEEKARTRSYCGELWRRATGYGPGQEKQLCICIGGPSGHARLASLQFLFSWRCLVGGMKN
jgi:hypothetical protein